MNKRMGFLCLLMIMIGASSFALYNRQGIPDSSEIRQNLVESWFTAPLEAVRGKMPELHRNNVGTVFQVRAEENDDYVMIIVAPRQKMAVDMYSGGAVLSSSVDVYPANNSGSWILYRNPTTGAPLFIRYYFASDADVFMQISSVNSIFI